MLARKGCPKRDWTVSSPSSSAPAGRVARLLLTASIAGKQRSGKRRLVFVVANFNAWDSKDFIDQRRLISHRRLTFYLKSWKRLCDSGWFGVRTVNYVTLLPVGYFTVCRLPWRFLRAIERRCPPLLQGQPPVHGRNVLA